jgi:hypothetical protein
LSLQEPNMVTCSIRRQSWDFMSPEIVKPLAMIWASDLAVLAVRLGMVWLEFDPADRRVLNAQGNGLVLESSWLRSVGTTVSIQWYSDPCYSARKMPLPTHQADQMIFGNVSSDILGPFTYGHFNDMKRLLGDWKINIADDLKAKLDEWDPSLPSYGFIEVIPLSANFVRHPGSCVTELPAPVMHPWGILHSHTCRRVFPNELQHFLESNSEISKTDQSIMRAVLEKCDDLPDIPTDCWHAWTWMSYNGIKRDQVRADLEIVHEYGALYTQFLSHPDHNSLARHVIYSHLRLSIRAHADAENAIRDGKQYTHAFRAELPPSPNRWQWEPLFAETVHLWFQRLEDLHRGVQTRIDTHSTAYEGVPITLGRVAAIWAVLIFRGLCWTSCHQLMDMGHVDSKYSQSRMPIYIM